MDEMSLTLILVVIFFSWSSWCWSGHERPFLVLWYCVLPPEWKWYIDEDQYMINVLVLNLLFDYAWKHVFLNRQTLSLAIILGPTSKLKYHRGKSKQVLIWILFISVFSISTRRTFSWAIILDSSPKLKDHRGNQSKYQTYNNCLYLVFHRGEIITTLQPYFCSDIVH